MKSVVDMNENWYGPSMNTMETRRGSRCGCLASMSPGTRNILLGSGT
jgi:hypothetical protein